MTRKNFKPFKDDCYRLVKYIKCFWCPLKLSRSSATVDHLVSQEMRGSDDPINLVICCKSCQLDRSQISYLHSVLKQIKRIKQPNIKKTRLNQLKSRIEQYKEKCIKYYNLCQQLLKEEILDLCLKEIEELLEII